MRKLIITLIGVLLVVIGAVATRQYDMTYMEPVRIITLADIKTDKAYMFAEENHKGSLFSCGTCTQKSWSPDEATNIKTVAEQFKQ